MTEIDKASKDSNCLLSHQYTVFAEHRGYELTLFLEHGSTRTATNCENKKLQHEMKPGNLTQRTFIQIGLIWLLYKNNQTNCFLFRCCFPLSGLVILANSALNGKCDTCVIHLSTKKQILDNIKIIYLGQYKKKYVLLKYYTLPCRPCYMQEQGCLFRLSSSQYQDPTLFFLLLKVCVGKNVK